MSTVKGRFFALLASLLLVSVVLLGGEVARTSEVQRRLVLLQQRFLSIALAYDAAIVCGLQNNPKPDWELRSTPSEIDNEYDRLLLIWNTVRHDPALAGRIANEKRSSHFDALALFTECQDWCCELSDNIPPQAIRDFGQYQTQGDPFAPNCFLGYISTFQDYWLISVGPDGKSDILGFKQYRDGSYRSEGNQQELGTSDLLRVAAAARAQFRDTPYSTFDSLSIGSRDLIYDPTNGIESRGDIVFHRRGGDDWLFSYPGSFLLTPKNIIPKKIEPPVTTPP